MGTKSLVTFVIRDLTTNMRLVEFQMLDMHYQPEEQSTRMTEEMKKSCLNVIITYTPTYWCKRPPPPKKKKKKKKNF